jgi:hypothetical protein
MTSYIKWFELAAAIIALLNWKRISRDVFLKHLALLIIFIAVAEFFGYGFKFYKKYNVLIYNFIIEPAMFTLYGLAFYKGYKNAKHKQFAYYGIFIVLILYAITLYFTDVGKILNIIGYNIGALYIACISVLKILEIINADDDIDYLKEPLLYLLLSVVFYYLITIPHFSITYYFYTHHIKNSAGGFLNYINVIFNYLLYICYCIIFILWGKKK